MKVIKILMLGLALFGTSLTINAADGVISVQSQFSVSETAERLVNLINKKGMTLFNQVKHSKSAKKVGLDLRETELVIFGNPKVGSLLMQCQQSIAIDLPLKALIWKDEASKVWVSYNDINYLAKRHKLTDCKNIISKVDGALNKIMHSTAGH